MAYSHFYFIEEEDMQAIQQLFENKINYQYYVLSISGEYCDIVQWTDKYQNVKFITVKNTSLDKRNELVF